MAQSINHIKVELLSEVFGYGDNIISQVPTFRDFCVACIDHIGEHCIPYIKSVYAGLRHLVPVYIAAKMDSYDLVNDVTESEIAKWYETFKEAEQKRCLEKEFKDNIDELQRRCWISSGDSNGWLHIMRCLCKCSSREQDWYSMVKIGPLLTGVLRKMRNVLSP